MRAVVLRFIVGCCLSALLLVSPALAQCTDLDGDGFVVGGIVCGINQDCNDGDPETYPGAPELCDGYDNDCNGAIDDDPGCDTTCDPPEVIGESTDLFPTFGDPVWTGTEYGIVRVGGESRVLGRYDIDGNELATPVLLYTSGGFPILLWTGSGYTAVWEVFGQGIAFQRFDATGTALAPMHFLTTDATTPRGAVWTGSQYTVIWWQSGTHRFARFDATGSALGPSSDLGDLGFIRSFIWTGTEYALYLQDGLQIDFLRLAEDGTPLGSPVLVKNCLFSCTAYEMVWTGTEYGLTYRDRFEPVGDYQVFFLRLGPTGQALGNPLQLSDDLGSAGLLAWSGSEYAVYWNQLSGRRFQNIDTSGDLIGDPIVPESAQLLFWNGTDYNTISSDFFARIGCNCNDGDLDGTSVCNDCDDLNDQVYPGAPELCDGLNNDCEDASWPAVSGIELDDDGDTLSECAGDCDDTKIDVYPGAPQICDGLNNDCDDAGYPAPPANELDADGDTFIGCAECDDTEIDVYPGAPQICDGLNNDCDDGSWPTPPPDDADVDMDNFAICAGDCADGDDTRFPGAEEVCNALDDDCDTLVDEDEAGEDTDGDTVHNACDNCPFDFNTSQLDADEDDVGNSCDNCLIDFNPDQLDQDSDTHGDACDNCPADSNSNQNDFDSDGAGDACDCAVTDPDIYPDAPEINDGSDNQCFGDYGYGMVDETSGNSGFHDPENKNAYSWTPQSGATSYEAVRSAISDFSGGCASIVSGGTLWDDPTEPGPYGVLAYLNRPMAPNIGSWGPSSAGERTGVCP